MSPDFEAKIVEVFGELAEKGFVYRGLKPFLWCASCETALADAEVEYADHASNSIYVQFPVWKDPNGIFGRGDENPTASYIVIWTTTPWTIPANLALAVHPDEDYIVDEVDGKHYLMAEALREQVVKVLLSDRADAEVALRLSGGQDVIWRGKGAELDGLIARHTLFDR